VVTRLDRLTVVETALRLLNETGLEGLSLRRIATELDVKAPALYWHFDSKQALLDEMATELMRSMVDAGAQADLPADVRWQDLLADSMRRLRATLLKYRDGAKMFSGTRFIGTVYAEALDRMVGALVGQGFAVRAAGRAWFTCSTYTVGFVVEEQAVYPRPGERDPHYDLAERAERLKDYPLAAAIGAEIFDDYDSGFESGLAIVIEGIAATLAPREGSAAPA
jgi:TetR/AcrR family transcriptional regulator, tetracycline repressor protein